MAIEFVSGGGQGQRIDCGSGSSIDNLSAKSIAFWLFSDVLDTSTRAIMAKGVFPAGWNVSTDDDDGADTILFRQGFATDGLWRMPTSAIAISTWYHVCITHSDRTSTAVNPIMYLNGISQTVTENAAPVGAADDESAGPLLIGGRATSPDFDGKLHDVRVFNRVLTAQEATILAGGYRGALGGEVVWLSMLDGQGVNHWDGTGLTTSNILPDLSGNGNDGTPKAVSGTPTARASDAPILPLGHLWGFYETAVAPATPGAPPTPSPEAPPTPASFRLSLRAKHRSLNLHARERDVSLTAKARRFNLKDGQREVR